MKKHKPLFLLLYGAIAMLPISALAHTGAGAADGFGSGFSHPLGGADHLLAMLAVGLWAAQMGGRALWVVPGAFVTLMLGGGGLALAGISLPYVEQVILLSVLVLSSLIAAVFKLPLFAGATLVGLFAVFHGHAHGGEMPQAVEAVSYSFGFVMATALLHAAGMAGAVALKKLKIEKSVRLAGGAIALCSVYWMVA